MNINSLIEWQNEEAKRVERVLAFLPNNLVATIDINETGISHKLTDKKELLKSLKYGEAVVLKEDPYAYKNRPEEDIPERSRAIRDKALKLIRPIIELTPEEFFDKGVRWQAIKKVLNSSGKNVKIVYALVRKYLVGGQIHNALLPDYRYIRKRVKQPGVRGETSLTKEDFEKFEKGVKEFYEIDNKPSLRRAYVQTMGKYYSKSITEIDGVIIAVLGSNSETPTLRQFRYWYKKYRNIAGMKRRVGEKKFNLKHRSVNVLSPTDIAKHPGAFYQMDSTVADINIISSITGKPIGKPNLYILVDVFSRCITGFNLTLNAPSYREASIALENAIADKEEYCSQAGIALESGSWPCHGVPKMILGDRGSEMTTENAKAWVDALGIRFQNAPAGRADLKGCVERAFGLLNNELFHRIPGSAPKESYDRGKKHPALNACITLKDLEKLLIHIIISLNSRVIAGYKLSPDMKKDGVEPIPNAIWEWGLKHGTLGYVEPDVVRANLLPSDTISVSQAGLRYQGLFYTCETGEKAGWFLRDRYTTRPKLKIHYDPRDTSFIYARINDRLEKCPLKKTSSGSENKYWEEIEIDTALRLEGDREKRVKPRLENAVSAILTLEKMLEEVANRSRPVDPVTQKPVPVTAKNIRKNRQEEMARTQATASSASDVADEIPMTSPEPAPVSEEKPTSTVDKDFVPRRSYAGQIRKITGKPAKE